MGNREECPVCKAYGSDLYSAFENGDDCPRCGASYNAIQSFLRMKMKSDFYIIDRCVLYFTFGYVFFEILRSFSQ